MPRILFTGGGTAGHVTPNIALIEAMSKKGWQCDYVGSYSGIERQLISEVGSNYHPISSGKLRRYFSWENFVDPFFVLFGFLQSLGICLRRRPDIVFSKGGFVAVPVVFAAWLLRIPVICHESDITPGLANKLSMPFCKKLCVNFQQSMDYLPESVKAEQVVVTGSPIRQGLVNTSKERGLSFLGFSSAKPIVMVVGGSLGARAINECVWENIHSLIERYSVVHLVGHGNARQDVSCEGYLQLEYLGAEYGDVLAASDMVISRAGANSLYELLLFRKPHLLIPLTAGASRGDQLVNARIMAEAGMSLVVQEAEFNQTTLRQSLQSLEATEQWQRAMQGFPDTDAVSVISDLLVETA